MHLPFQILYEDADVLMINKPSGMLSQKAKPDDISANEYILAYLLASGVVKKENLNTFRPSICNRLDRNTSGVLISGKTLKGLQEMSKQLRMREVKKFYHCIVEGNITASQHIRGYLRKDEKQNKVKILEKPEDKDDKFIETEYVPLENYKHADTLRSTSDHRTDTSDPCPFSVDQTSCDGRCKIRCKEKKWDYFTIITRIPFRIRKRRRDHCTLSKRV